MARLSPIDVQAKFWNVHHLMQMDIGCAFYFGNLSLQIESDLVVFHRVSTYHLDINGRRESEIQNLIDDIGRLKEEYASSELFR